MNEIKDLVKKTTLANVAGFTVVLLGLVAAIHFEKWEIAGTIIGAGVAYLFPKQTGETKAD